jgi:RNA polymerase sigma-70 factor (ECF subfamily)
MKKKHLLIPEDRIIGLIKAKDRKGFELLYKLYSNCLFNITLKIVHSRETAEDVLQDSFIKIWKHIDTYDPGKGSLFTFILNIARNTAIDKTRSLAYKQEINGLMFNPLLVDKREYVQQKTDLLGVSECINKLSPQHQDLIKYVYFDGYTHEEAAKVLEIPLGTAKSRLKAAIGQLRVLAV